MRSTHLTHLKLDPPDGLSVRDSKIGVQSGVTNYRRERIPVLVRQPLTKYDESTRRPESKRAPYLLLGDIRMAFQMSSETPSERRNCDDKPVPV